MIESLRALDTDILFEFIETIGKSSFDNTTQWGFVIKDKVQDLHTPRWGKVLSIGPAVTEVKVGNYILVENLQWTSKLTHGDADFWKTRESKVMLVSNDRPTNFG